MKAKSSTPATAGTPAVKTPATGIPTKAHCHISTDFTKNQQENWNLNISNSLEQ
jgi:hypothetical protein